jgi:hypothetical protein
MKGIIFNLFEETVTQEFGEAAWEEVLERSGVDGAYTSLGNYSDEEFLTLLKCMPIEVGATEDRARLLRWFGRRSIPPLAQRYPVFFTGHSSARSFLLTLNEIIHPEVRKLYPGATPPVFDFDAVAGIEGADRLVIGYRSARRLCALAEGFIEGAADHFGERVTIVQPVCMLEGHARCVLACTLSPGS